MPIFSGRTDYTKDGVTYTNITPIMTSNTTPSPYIANSSSGNGYLFFNNDYTTVNYPYDLITVNSGYVTLKLDTYKQVVGIRLRDRGGYYVSSMSIYGSSDNGSTYNFITTISPGKWTTDTGVILFNNNNKYNIYKFIPHGGETIAGGVVLTEIDLYQEKEYEGNRPLKASKITESSLPSASGKDTGEENLYFTDAHNTYITTKKGEPILVGTGDYNNLLNKPTIPGPYTLPAATATVLGGVKVGNNLTIDEDGVLSASASEITPATAEKLGGIKVGENLTIDESGVLSAEGTTVEVEQTLTSGTKIGTITVDDVGTDLYAPDITPLQTAIDTLNGTGDGSVQKQIATAIAGTSHITQQVVTEKPTVETAVANVQYLVETSKDGVYNVYALVTDAEGNKEIASLGTNEIDLSNYYNKTETDGLLDDKMDKVTLAAVATSGSYNDLSDKPEEYTLPTASADTLGGIKVGDNLSIDENGLLSATGGGSGSTVVVTADATSGGKVGNISVDGVGTDLYAPDEVAVSATEPTDENIKIWVDTTTNLPYSDVVVADFNDYSTDEIMIGRWIDGRPIYRKSYAVSSKLTLLSSTWTDTGISLGTTIIPIRGNIIINQIAESSYQVSVTNYATNNNLWIMYFRESGQVVPTTGYIVLEYTKTTDTADTFDANNLANVVANIEATTEEIEEVFE